MIFHQNPDPAHVDPGKVLHRELKNNARHRFEIRVVAGSMDDPMEISYLFSGKVESPQDKNSRKDILFQIENYSVSTRELRHHSKLTGTGKLILNDLGLPPYLMEKITDRTFLYPLLSLYLPVEIHDGSFDTEEPVATGIELVGKGKVKDRHYTFDGSFEEDRKKLATIEMKWVMSPEGWPTRAEGTVEDDKGTVTFTVRGG